MYGSVKSLVGVGSHSSATILGIQGLVASNLAEKVAAGDLHDHSNYPIVCYSVHILQSLFSRWINHYRAINSVEVRRAHRSP